MQPKYSIAASKVNDSFADEIDIYSVSAGWIAPYRECNFSEQLIRIDIDGHGHVFGKRQLIQRLAHEPAQTHDRFATHQNVEPELSLQFFQWRRRRIPQNEFRPERFFQSPRQRFRGKFRARLMSGTHCYQNRVLEGREIATLAKLEFLLEIAGEIVMPRELN